MTSKKLITAISMTCLMAVLLVVGVWAVTDIDFSVGGDISYTVPIIVEDPDDYEYLTFTVTDATAKTVSVETSRKGTMPTDLVIPAYVDIDGVTYAVTSIPGGYDSGRGFAYTSISSITLPDTLKSIADYAFEGCSATKLYVGMGIEEINYASFSSSSITYNVYENGNYLGSKTNPYLILCSINSTSITSFTIHEDCRILKGGTAGIGGLFQNCTSLESIIIPAKVKKIGSHAFEDCASLTSITIPNSVTSIGDSAFYGCTSLTSITIPNSVISIGNFAFDGCTNLTYNTYNNAKYLGNSTNPYVVLVSALSTDITSCTINSNCKVIYYQAFYNRKSLSSITIPDKVTSIGGEAFSACTSLATVEVKATTPPTGGYDMFLSCPLTTGIFVPSASVSAYRSAQYWNNYSSKIQAGSF